VGQCWSWWGLNNKGDKMPIPEDLRDLLYRPEEVAEMMRVSVKTLSRYAREGKIQCINLPGGQQRRYYKKDVIALFKSLTTEMSNVDGKGDANSSNT
jgi:excisionase family DNA binding protein